MCFSSPAHTKPRWHPIIPIRSVTKSFFPNLKEWSVANTKCPYKAKQGNLKKKMQWVSGSWNVILTTAEINCSYLTAVQLRRDEHKPCSNNTAEAGPWKTHSIKTKVLLRRQTYTVKLEGRGDEESLNLYISWTWQHFTSYKSV